MVDYPDDLWRSVADLTGMLLAEESPETTLRRVGDLAVRSMAACAAVGVTMFEEGRPVTWAATGGLVYEVDHFQYDIGAGPCLQAVLDQDVITVEEMSAETRWPRFCAHAAARGVHSSLSYPLLVRGESMGALNLYAYQPRAFGEVEREMGGLFAAQAAVVLSNATTYATSVRMAAQLREALDSRAVIDQAMGILMGQNGYDQNLAFADLRGASQQRNRKLRAVAQEIVDAARQGRTNSDQPGRGQV